MFRGHRCRIPRWRGVFRGVPVLVHRRHRRPLRVRGRRCRRRRGRQFILVIITELITPVRRTRPSRRVRPIRFRPNTLLSRRPFRLTVSLSVVMLRFNSVFTGSGDCAKRLNLVLPVIVRVGPRLLTPLVPRLTRPTVGLLSSTLNLMRGTLPVQSGRLRFCLTPWRL